MLTSRSVRKTDASGWTVEWTRKRAREVKDKRGPKGHRKKNERREADWQREEFF